MHSTIKAAIWNSPLKDLGWGQQFVFRKNPFGNQIKALFTFFTLVLNFTWLNVIAWAWSLILDLYNTYTVHLIKYSKFKAFSWAFDHILWPTLANGTIWHLSKFLSHEEGHGIWLKTLEKASNLTLSSDCFKRAAFVTSKSINLIKVIFKFDVNQNFILYTYCSFKWV